MNNPMSSEMMSVAECQRHFELVQTSFQSHVIGQNHVANRLLMALVADGHILLEGLPGLAKTTAVKTMAQLTSLNFSRIQFTPDLLPADVTGTQIFEPRTSTFAVRKGPIFSNIVLADEINRAPAKVQSALLEAMQEHQVTIGGETMSLDQPFLVMATQNPIEQEGTYPLPEAQVDRFMFKVHVGYLEPNDEKTLLKMAQEKNWQRPLQPLLKKSDIIRMRALASTIHVSEKIHDYIVRLVCATRTPQGGKLQGLKQWIEIGASPRASLCLEKSSRIHAMSQGRDFVLPEDVKAVALDILRHRLTLSFTAEAENMSREAIVQQILDHVPIP
jgi:MoxR-like ATPase